MSANAEQEVILDTHPADTLEDIAEEAAVRAEPGRVFDPGFWDTYLRCFFLIVVMVGVGFMAWRPGKLRFSILLSLARPSEGGSLTWRAEDNMAEPVRPVIRQRAPDEWRLNPGFDATAFTARRPAKRTDLKPLVAGGRDWRRQSYNPWRWQDDQTPVHVLTLAARGDGQPLQKPATSYRASADEMWAEAPDSSPAGLGNGNSLAGLPELPRLPVLAGQTEPAASLQSTGGDASASAQAPSALDLFSSLPPLQPLTAEETGAPATPAIQPQRQEQPTAGPVTTASTDWTSEEITTVLPDAYLTVYPKLNFIGLCVPGQGYVRKYQAGVPADTTQPKTSGSDGRTPYGRYYVTAKSLGANGPEIRLSWPSPDDAMRLGLPQNELAAVDNAWQNRSIPPQNTAAGGGVAIGYGDVQAGTTGGFTLELPQLEELYTALPVGAWVFVQQ